MKSSSRNTRPRTSRLALGLMSGTSMDGVDAALVRVAGTPERPRVRLLAFLTMPYAPWLQQRLLEMASGSPTNTGEISRLNFLLGEVFAEAALRVCRRAQVAPAKLTVIGSHGQTLFHQGPRAGAAERRGARGGLLDMHSGGTLQIAEPAIIAERTRVPVVADFRAADVAAGGHGAPLVPLVDYLLLRHPRKGTVALNIGGIANVAVIPPSAKPDEVFGFDTGPGNMVIDALVHRFTQGRKSYDAGGRWAATGQVLEPLLADLLRFPFFRRHPPKSAGREEFGPRFVEKNFPRMKRPRREDLLCTATELTVRTIVEALRSFVLARVAIQRLIVSGGGAHNRLLVRQLKDLLPELDVRPSDDYGLPVDAKEAIAFALLADRTLQGLPGNLPRVTGAQRSVILGKIVRP
ncbi:MAG TPA: anhydro-N-acetylmuramic acid kinase [Terriglobia bacterium]|nr:anhydro-N-acetylmuramic acid kinase [Terriglobia bacterium]